MDFVDSYLVLQRGMGCEVKNCDKRPKGIILSDRYDQRNEVCIRYGNRWINT